MLFEEALILLGLSWSDCDNPKEINRAWKQKLLYVHPDKSKVRNATERTQRLNEAKDVLLAEFATEEDLLAKEEQEAEEERAAYEKEKAAFEQKCNEMNQKAELDLRERYTKNRRKRAEGSRIHRKIEDYPEGKALVEDMKTFFKDSFISESAYVSMADIMLLFVKSRENTSDLEKRLFHRHAKRLFAAAWPSAHYTKHSNKWTFYGVAMKKQ